MLSGIINPTNGEYIL